MPDWPIDRLRRARRAALPEGSRGSGAPAERAPVALTERLAKGVRIAAACPSARAMGVVVGQTLADARARVPGLASEEIDRQADAAALEALAHWAMRWSPTVALDGRDALMIEVSGSAHLWGGEAGLMADVSARLDRAGIAHRLGLGPTPGAAWALSHAGREPLSRLGEGVRGPKAVAAGLADLPVAGLRLGDAALTLMRRFGITRIGQLTGLDRAALAQRFRSTEIADRALLRLDQATGRLAEPLVPLAEPPEHVVRLPCPEPLIDSAGVEAGLSLLLGRLSDALEAAGMGARRVRLSAHRADGGLARIEVATARPVRDPAHLMRLFAERLERIDPGHGIDLLRLEAAWTAPLEAAARPLARHIAADPTEAEALAALADRLVARLGEGAVAILAPEESHLPERAERLTPFEGAPAAWEGATPPGTAPRPVRLLARPEPVDVVAAVPDGPPVRFIWRRVARAVTRAEGPERIAPEWWRAVPGAADPPRARDYFRVEDAEGGRYWIYRDGLFGDGRGGGTAPAGDVDGDGDAAPRPAAESMPRWYLHGLFA